MLVRDGGLLATPAAPNETRESKAPSAVDIAALIKDLAKTETATWREAQVRLAATGPGILDPLDVLATAQRANADLLRRITDVLAVALLTSVRWEDVSQRNELVRLASPHVDKGRTLAVKLAKQEILDIGEAPNLPPGAEHEPSEIETALGDFRALSGFSAPAISDLLAHSNPVARGYGILLVGRVGALARERETLEKLQNDGAAIRVRGACWVGHSTVGKEAEEVLKVYPRREGLALDIGKVIHRFYVLNKADGASDLINGMRQTSQVFRSESSDEWWEAARPVWKKWWEMAGTGYQPQDREEWLNVLRAREGFSLVRTPNPDGSSKLVLSVPEGARYQVYFDDQLQREGTGDLDLDGAPKRTLQIVVIHANGVKWQHPFVSNFGHTFTIRVFKPER